MKRTIAKLGFTAVVVLLGGNVAQVNGQTVYMSLNYSSSAPYVGPYAEMGSSALYNGLPLLGTSAELGIYAFTVQNNGGLNISTPFYSVCLSPAGDLTTGSLGYTLQTFVQAQPGLSPSGWASPSGAPLAGIENANYLFTTLGTVIDGGSKITGQSGTLADQGTALALAMYAALYNSTGYGAAGTGTGTSGFNVSKFADSSVATDYGLDLADLKGFSGGGTGGVLVPLNQPAGGQDMIVLGTGLPNVYSPVPEPTTIIAGALLLLPLGASTVRILRKHRGD